MDAKKKCVGGNIEAVYGVQILYRPGNRKKLISKKGS